MLFKKYAKKHDEIDSPKQNNCSSKNFKAIAEVHYGQHKRLENTSPDESEYSREQWLYYQQMAMINEDEENSKFKSKKWNKVYRCDPKKLWKMIDWKGCENTEKKGNVTNYSP